MNVLDDAEFDLPVDFICWATCEGPIHVEVVERWEDSGLPAPGGVLAGCAKGCNPEDYEELLHWSAAAIRFAEQEVARQRRYELSVFGESKLPDLEYV